ncbi:MAG: putative nucleotidyltransferase substrate binding domain-containing protein, partial [Chromatiales bacterium]
DYLYIVRSGAIEIRDNDNTLINKLAENDYYSDCLVLDRDQYHGKTLEDTLLYQLTCRQLARLRKTSKKFDQHFSDSLSKRLKQAASRLSQPVDSGMAHMAVEVKQLINHSPLLMPADSTIQAVAQQMTQRQVSSALLTSNDQLAGMITDRDLRRRCVATGLDVQTPVSQIMTTELHTIEDSTLALHALMTMTRMNVHHLPVVHGKDIIGMLSATDITQHSSSNPAFIMSDIHKAQSLDDLVVASKRLPDLQVQLNNANASSVHIGDMISRITDAITVRLIEMAEAELGPAPLPYVWVAGGSQARREQTSHSDQDNALIIDDALRPEHEDWFMQLARRVNDGLNACGFVYCPGDAMASNPQWRQPVKTWKKYFDEWIDKPEPMALMLSSIFFDLRPVYGKRSLFEQVQQHSLAKTKKAGIFIAYMAANALTHRPPLGFFRRFVLIHGGEHKETFDIKHRGITPITDIARLLALSEGLSEINTTKRLRAASQTKALSEEMAENLEDALAFIAELRICHQAQQIRKGVPADNYLSPNKMSELDRKHLKDAFSVIQSMQELLEHRYNTGRLG